MKHIAGIISLLLINTSAFAISNTAHCVALNKSKRFSISFPALAAGTIWVAPGKVEEGSEDRYVNEDPEALEELDIIPEGIASDEDWEDSPLFKKIKGKMRKSGSRTIYYSLRGEVNLEEGTFRVQANSTNKIAEAFIACDLSVLPRSFD